MKEEWKAVVLFHIAVRLCFFVLVIEPDVALKAFKGGARGEQSKLSWLAMYCFFQNSRWAGLGAPGLMNGTVNRPAKMPGEERDRRGESYRSGVARRRTL